jgi:hypothetical protein
MWVNNLWWLKFFNHPSLWLLKLFNHHRKKGGEGGGGGVIFFRKPSMKAFKIDATS